MIKSICVYCGASFNGDQGLKSIVERLGSLMAKNNIRLVFGGGSVGLMGVIADAVLKSGGEAIGVMPQFLMDKEVGHPGLTEMIVTEIAI